MAKSPERNDHVIKRYTFFCDVLYIARQDDDDDGGGRR